MTTIMLSVKINEPATAEQIARYEEIMQVLLDKGALDGMRAGTASLHFDSQGVFQGVEMHYWPWKRRAKDR